MLALIPPIFSRSTFRMNSWYLLLTCNIIYCAIHIMLLGRQSPSGPDPSTTLCLIQAGLVYTAPPLLAGAGVVFVFELYLRLTATVLHKAFRQDRVTAMMWALSAVPTVVFWTDGLIALNKPLTIERNSAGFFCHIHQQFCPILTGVLSLLLVIAMLWYEVMIIIAMARNGCFGVKEGGGLSIDPAFPMKMFVRIICVSLIGLFSLM
jgi:hypothetical protein